MMRALYKPAPPHNGLLAPAMCLCVECSRQVLVLRCPHRDRDGNQCGDYRAHRAPHTILVATVFAIAAERATP